MRRSINAAYVALALAGASTLVAGCVVEPRGEVAFGYSDGYWDRNHQWHAWASDRDAASFRDSNHDHYYDRKHDQDRDQGWRDSDRYWEHH